MLTITDGGSLWRALSSSIDPSLKRLLTDRVRQLDVHDLSDAARFVIVQPGDTPDAIEQELSFSIFQNLADGTRCGDTDYSPGFEWIEDHGFAFEVVFMFTDDGFAHVIFLPRAEGIDADLLKLCAAYADKQAVS